MLSNMHPTIRLFILFIGLSCLSLLTAFTNAMIIWFIVIGVLSILFIQQNKEQVEKFDIIVGTVLSLLVMFSNVFIGLFILPSYLASMCIFKVSFQKVKFYHKGECLRTIASIFICGGILAAINLFLASGQYSFHISMKISYLFNALQAGIFEEIVLRLFLFALCMKVTGCIQYNHYQNILSYCIMIVPHALLHFSNSIDIMSILILILLFGLPLALLQRKLNLLSAIGAHAFIDFVRFIFIGI